MPYRQEQLEALSSSEKLTTEKMFFFKRDTENRGTNFNNRFSTARERSGINNSNQESDSVSSSGVLRVIQNSSKISAQGLPNIVKKQTQEQLQQNRRQGRGASGTTKKVPKAKKTNTSLPKVATNLTAESN